MLEAEWKNLYHKLYKFCFIENENKLQWPLMYTHCLEAKNQNMAYFESCDSYPSPGDVHVGHHCPLVYRRVVSLHQAVTCGVI